MHMTSEAIIIEPLDLLASATADGAIWSHSSEQLNINLVRLSPGEGIALHINSEVDVWCVVVAGEGRLTLGDEEHHISAGQACLIPRGIPRSIQALRSPLAYLSCHRRRAGLMPVGPDER
ncbi:MAG: hypothetical protein KatS3mg057_0612 [Herpetosiphonaceae bacterium]|nr:MAG: hypothetical protein KatS3mg057_0612 [Herpetosiphonaceae bacterium]